MKNKDYEIKEMDKTCFPVYDQVTQNVDVRSEYRVTRIDNGLGGLGIEKVPVTPFVKDLGIAGAKVDGYKLMIIECQNNNVPACQFYKKQGALLSRIDMDAYDSEPGIADEVQFIWHLDLTDYHRDSVV